MRRDCGQPKSQGQGVTKKLILRLELIRAVGDIFPCSRSGSGMSPKPDTSFASHTAITTPAGPTGVSAHRRSPPLHDPLDRGPRFGTLPIDGTPPRGRMGDWR